MIERCSGHNGTYAVKQEFHDASVKIGKPVVQPRRTAPAPCYYSSDCPMAGQQIGTASPATRPPDPPAYAAAHRLRTPAS